MGLVSLLVSFGMAASLAKGYGLPERLSGLTGSVSFMLLAGFYQNGGVDVRYLGGMGIFTAIIASIYSIEVIRFSTNETGRFESRMKYLKSPPVVFC